MNWPRSPLAGTMHDRLDWGRRRMAVASIALVGFPAVLLGRTVRGRDHTIATLRISETVVRPALPDGFLGLNLNFLNFQEDFAPDGQVDPVVMQLLAALPRMVYRYPGGLVANAFDWEAASGPVSRRTAQQVLDRRAAKPVLFGPSEYVDFVKAVGGQTWFVLNLVGWSADERLTELPIEMVAASAGRLAGWRRENDLLAPPRHYQLGNELDRSDYEWPAEKYLERCLAVARRVRDADPGAELVPFIRDFDWRYRKSAAVSPAVDFTQTVLRGLAPASDYSMNVYYDAARRGRRTDIAFRLASMRRIVQTASAVEAPSARGLWITEHARQLPENKRSGGVADTSGIDGAISSADFLAAVAAWPEVRGAFWHALGGGRKWSLFERSGTSTVPTAIYWVLRLLNDNRRGQVLASEIDSPNSSAYEGGYDVRCLALSATDRRTATVWAVNRSDRAVPLRTVRHGYSGQRALASIASVRATGSPTDPTAVEVDLDPRSDTIQFDSSGSWTVELPPKSVCALRLGLTGS